MRRIITLLAVFVLFLVLGACGNSSSESSGKDDGEQKLAKELKLFSFGDYWPEDVLKGFEEKYGVKVIYDPYGSNAEMLTKIQSGAVDYDIVVPTDYIAGRMIQKDMLQELDMDNIPNFKNINSLFHERDYDPSNKYTVPYLYGYIGMVYDKTKVKDPVGWEDLWIPEYAGHVLLSNVGREALTVALQKNGYSQNDASDEALKAAKKDLLALHPNVYAYESTASDILSGNDVWIGAAYSGTVGMAMKKNENLMFKIPKEGGTIWMDNLAIPKVSKNKYTAEVFINYVLEPEVSKKISDEIPYSNPNSAAVELMGDEEKNNPAAYPPEEDVKRADWYKDMGKNLTKMDHTWREVIGQ